MSQSVEGGDWRDDSEEWKGSDVEEEQESEFIDEVDESDDGEV